MKICAIIAEYNPFHLGHLKQIDYVKNNLGADKIIVIMSGNFTQRGEIAIMDKFTRAKHAVLSGADAVIELPAIFATCNAEIFARGAINIINSIGCVDSICFGVESGTKEEYISLATALNNESKDFKKLLKLKLDSGISLAKAKFETVKELYDSKFNEKLISSPNNILALEYTKALLKLNSNIEIFPMVRDGDHNDVTLKKGITSATSIRETIKLGKKKKLKKSMPEYVYDDLKDYPFIIDKIIMSKIITSTPQDIARVMDCTEGLENRIKAFSKDNTTISSLVDKVSTKRYTKTRVQRILIGLLLGIDEFTIRDCIDKPLYAKILAIKESEKNLISLISTRSTIPVLTRKSDTMLLSRQGKNCFDIDVIANDLYNLISENKQNEHQMLFV